MRTFRSLFLSLALLTVASFAQADDAAKSPEVVRLLQAKQTMKWNRPIGAERYGHAEAIVGASVEKLGKTIGDYGHYRELHQKFATARVIAKESNRTDVYMRYPVKIGLVRIDMYEVLRFTPDDIIDGQHVVEARGISGDMKHAHTIITYKAIDATHSLLQVDVLLVPKMPAPQRFIDEELRDGAEDFVNGLKDKAQGWPGPVLSL
ncbi:MAG: hypothetical protein JWM74_3190 [Myxococcaceae bacterium]|jgi:hypothetical protein|nr:hypothetical protein [Myxococcaceae bacterium]